MSTSLTHRVVIETDKLSLDALCAVLEVAGLDDGTSWEPADHDSVAVVFYRDSLADALALLDDVKAILSESPLGARCTCSSDTIENEDWETAWKKFFHAAKVSDRIVVRPSWEEWRGEAGLQEIVVDPGMSFGTGLHATTRACIRFLDKLGESEDSFLDVGCGSGILSIAAAKLGFGSIRAFDVDPEAVACTISNIGSNGLSESITDVQCADIISMNEDVSYDVVAVNILAPVIEASTANIARLVDRDGGYLILAGLDSGQFDRISLMFMDGEFALIERVEEGEWVSGLLRRERSGI